VALLMVPATGMRQFVNDRLGDTLARCRFLAPVGFIDRIEPMVHPLPVRLREREHDAASMLIVRLALLPALLAAGHRDVPALPPHAAHEELIIDLECLLEAFLDRGQLVFIGVPGGRATGAAHPPTRNPTASVTLRARRAQAGPAARAAADCMNPSGNTHSSARFRWEAVPKAVSLPRAEQLLEERRFLLAVGIHRPALPLRLQRVVLRHPLRVLQQPVPRS
jgi:hypothetical protein